MPEWGKYPILDVVMKLHAIISGSGDPLPKGLSKRYYEYLKGRVELMIGCIMKDQNGYILIMLFCSCAKLL
jgi:putative heme iron utilization protein